MAGFLHVKLLLTLPFSRPSRNGDCIGQLTVGRSGCPRDWTQAELLGDRTLAYVKRPSDRLKHHMRFSSEYMSCITVTVVWISIPLPGLHVTRADV